MRILNESELELIFGGDGYGTTTLESVKVTAPSYQSIGNYFNFSYSAPYTESGGGGSGGSYHAPANSALPPSQVPNVAKLRCQANAAAVPGHAPSDVPGYSLDFYNTHAYQYNGSTSVYFTKGSDNQPAGTTQLRGQTYPNSLTKNEATGAYSGGAVKIYADAAIATTGNTYSHSYYDDSNNFVSQGVSLGVLSAEENALMVTLHEFQHAYQSANPSWMASQGRANTAANIEADAETFAIKGLERFRAGNKGTCN
ncbi:hypothetical protein [Pseudoxanthomonas sp. USHLN014]|uniref:hypothetical protein n=1 Tax=Pseudoxanthomonas sp. USHLN014 TaxID=3081297 RepID=UPI00301D966B